MISCVLAGFLFYLWGRSGVLTGILFLLGLLIYFTQELGLNLGFVSEILLVCSVLALPLSFYIAGSLLDNFIAERFSKQLPLALIFLLFGLYIIIEQGIFFDQLEYSVKLISNPSSLSPLFLLLEILTKTIMTTTGVVLTIMFVALCFILPFAWFAKNSRLNLSWAVPSITLVLVLFLISSSYQLILTKLFA